jgi:sulfotransferase family protein
MTRLVYILAASHSGSTLLAMLLGAHPEVCSVGELKCTSMRNIERYRCSCGMPILQCPFWRDVRGALERRGVTFDMSNARTDVRAIATTFEKRLLSPLHRGPWLELLRDAGLALSPGWRSRLREHQARNLALAQAVLARSGKQVLVDSSKIAVRLKYLLRAPGFDIRVIRLVRDGRAVALTYTNPAEFADAVDPVLREGGCGGNRAWQRVPMATAAREWRRSNEEAATILASMDRSRWTDLRYEDLCADPQSALKRLFLFIDVDAALGTLRFRDTEHHVVGNGMRLDTTSEIRMDDRWTRALSRQQLDTFGSVAGALNRQLGYA